MTADAIKFRHPPRHEGCDCFLLEGGTFRTGGLCIRGDCDCRQFDGMYAGYEAEVAIAVARLRGLHDRRTDVGCSAETPCNWPGCPYGRRVETLPTGAVPGEGARGSISFEEAVNTRPTGVVTQAESPGAVPPSIGIRRLGLRQTSPEEVNAFFAQKPRVTLRTAVIEPGQLVATGVVTGTSFGADIGNVPDVVGLELVPTGRTVGGSVEFGPPVPSDGSFGLHVVEPAPIDAAALNFAPVTGAIDGAVLMRKDGEIIDAFGTAGHLKPEHPAPWRWREPFEHEDGIFMHPLDDANGKCVVAELGGVESPLARELIRAAPEMEEALRYFVTMLGDIRPAHPKMVAAMSILASIDAARKATT